MRHEKKGLTSYIGNVRIQQGSLELLADNVTVYSLADGSTEVQATGQPARFSQQPSPEQAMINARAEAIHYDIGSGRIELTGDARLQQGEASVSSAHIVYMIDEQVFRAGADQKDSAEGATRERVQVIIPAQKQPTDSNQP